MVWLFWMTSAMAGGWAEPVSVERVATRDDVTTVTLRGDGPLFETCPTLTLDVKHEWVPWYAWMPGVDTHHPGPLQTAAALDHLKTAHRDGETVVFGAMGTGFAETAPCRFRSKGLSVEPDGAILSFHNPI